MRSFPIKNPSISTKIVNSISCGQVYNPCLFTGKINGFEVENLQESRTLIENLADFGIIEVKH